MEEVMIWLIQTLALISVFAGAMWALMLVIH